MPAKLIGDYSRYPEAIRKVVPLIAGEVLMLRQNWAIYFRLFMESQARTDALAQHAGNLLGVVQALLQDQLFLSVSRLTDRDGKAQDNLSLWRLIEAAKEAGDHEFAQKTERDLETLCANASSVRKHRHKRIAHFDLQVSINETALPTVTFAEIRSLIEAVEAWLNQFNWYYQESTTLFRIISGEEATGSVEATVAKAIVYERLAKDNIAQRAWRDVMKEWAEQGGGHVR